ncbi:MAG: nitroreductase family protein [Spirochaetes bacterium]|nr:nitroreductase family protein [Spirochaetota bacterium]
MNLQEAIENRRAYRSLVPVVITENMVSELAKAASLAPSCYNNQPWRFVFVYEKTKLEELKKTLAKGNEWAHKASMIIAVFSKEKDDCVLKNRIYHQFDTGMATALLLLKATELGLVAHPIAGYDEAEVHKVCNIPDEYTVITLIIIGKKDSTIHDDLTEWQKESEKIRPPRKALEEFAFHNVYR